MLNGRLLIVLILISSSQASLINAESSQVLTLIPWRQGVNRIQMGNL